MSAPFALRPILVLAALAASLAAQSSATIDTTGVGCQGGGALLTGGTAASADITTDYDPATGVLQLTVANTSPVVAGQATPVISAVYLNLPPRAIDAASLIGQAGSGGASPAFTLSFDADTTAGPNPISVACFGRFNIGLVTGPGATGGIANPSATTIAAPSPVIGPVTFQLQLGGPGAGGLSSEAILASFSNGAAAGDVTVAAKFQAGGVGGGESGFVGNAGGCRTAFYVIGTPAPGNTIEICLTGGNGCHACPWASLYPGPVTIQGITIPIGLPLLVTFFNYADFIGTHEVCLPPITIPNNPSLSGLVLYWTNLTYPLGNPAAYSFSEPYVLTVL